MRYERYYYEAPVTDDGLVGEPAGVPSADSGGELSGEPTGDIAGPLTAIQVLSHNNNISI